MRALRTAGSLYTKNVTSVLSTYLLLMLIPIVLQIYLLTTYLSVHFGRPANENESFLAIVATIAPGDPHYFAWAFTRMFGDLITPFALAWLILAIKHIIRTGKTEPIKCLEHLGHKWLAVAQYGLMMHIIWYAWNEVIQMISNHPHSDLFIYAIDLLLSITYVILIFGYTAGLVVVTLDQVDPIRALFFGMWFGLLSSFRSLTRFMLLTAIVLVGDCFYAFAISFDPIVVSFLCILGFTVFYSWIYFAIVLFVLHRIANQEHVDLPKWPRVRIGPRW